ncbi:hypothetical protein B0T16DRAFT_415319 [Cercophora newfieldiana]|uniref:Uncharacterized protein n=1 Tax=Cercophora newfieldiana TaxID=92897 RepID=A0AA39XZC5_9PEZI|nr:hypothetical protein B0T16DRAFT_415319 [Cercophora newfieldiana]
MWSLGCTLIYMYALKGILFILYFIFIFVPDTPVIQVLISLTGTYPFSCIIALHWLVSISDPYPFRKMVVFFWVFFFGVFCVFVLTFCVFCVFVFFRVCQQET